MKWQTDVCSFVISILAICEKKQKESFIVTDSVFSGIYKFMNEKMWRFVQTISLSCLFFFRIYLLSKYDKLVVLMGFF